MNSPDIHREPTGRAIDILIDAQAIRATPEEIARPFVAALTLPTAQQADWVTTEPADQVFVCDCDLPPSIVPV